MTKPKPTRKRKTKNDLASAEIAVPPPPPAVVEAEVQVPSRTDSGTFAPGVSGNPAGRPKGTRNMITLERENLELALRAYMNSPENRKRALAAIDRLIALGLGNDEGVAVKALKILFDKVLPSPKPAEEQQGNDRPAVHIVIENATQPRTVIDGEFAESP